MLDFEEMVNSFEELDFEELDSRFDPEVLEIWADSDFNIYYNEVTDQYAVCENAEIIILIDDAEELSEYFIEEVA